MSATLDFIKANEGYVATFGERAKLDIPPAKRIAVVTCMDARLDPAKHLGLSEGDAHVIRNAGGAAEESLRSLLVSQRILNTREIAVFRHTDCGMLKFTTPQLQDILKHSHPHDEAIAKEVDGLDFLTFEDLEKDLEKDLKFLRESPLILKETNITGWIYDVRSGKITQVA